MVSMTRLALRSRQQMRRDHLFQFQTDQNYSVVYKTISEKLGKLTQVIRVALSAFSAT